MGDKAAAAAMAAAASTLPIMSGPLVGDDEPPLEAEAAAATIMGAAPDGGDEDCEPSENPGLALLESAGDVVVTTMDGLWFVLLLSMGVVDAVSAVMMRMTYSRRHQVLFWHPRFDRFSCKINSVPQQRDNDQ